MPVATAPHTLAELLAVRRAAARSGLDADSEMFASIDGRADQIAHEARLAKVDRVALEQASLRELDAALARLTRTR